MRLDRMMLGLAIVLLGAAVWTTAMRVSDNTAAQAVAAPVTASTPTSPAGDVETRVKKLETASGGVGSLMLEIQFHFAKLYYAGEARNWDLATYERNQIEEAIEKVGVLRPSENNVKLDDVITILKQAPLAAIKDAIDVKDRNLFRQGYNDTTAMCNACHQATGRAFITIIPPTNAPVSNQRWTAQ